MRFLPALLVALLLLFGVGLSLKVMWGSTAHVEVSTEDMPEFLGGKPQGHVYTGVAEEPSDVNPFTTSDNVARGLVLRYTHDTLLDRDPGDGLLRPALAEQFEPAADGASCVFTLRTGVVFSDGSPLRMEDVLLGWRLHEAGHLTMGFCKAAFRRVDKVEVLDDRRFRVHFKDRHFAAVEVVGESWIVGNHDWFVAQVRARLEPDEQMPSIDSERFAELLGQIDEQCGPGTGPYALYNEPDGRSTWRRRQDLTVVRHEGSWRRVVDPGSWNFAGFRTLFRPDANGAKNALLRGEVDWYSDPQVDALLAARPELKERYRRYVYDYNRLGVYRIVWNCKRPPFDDVRVRRALGMLIDRGELLKIFDGSALPAVAHAKAGSPSYPQLDPLPYDPKAARKLLRECGYDGEQNKLKLSLLALQGLAPLRRILELFTAAAREAGIELEVRPRDTMASFVAEKQLYDWDGMLVLQFFESQHDPYRYLHSEGLDNEGKWHDARADELAEQAQVEHDAAHRAALWRELHAIAHDQQPVALIVHPLVAVLANKDVQDLVPGPLGLRPDHAWVAPENQRR